MNETEPPIFGEINADAFKIFSSGSKHFYASLLENLSEAVFDDSGFVERTTVIQEIEQFTLKSSQGTDEDVKTDINIRANGIYTRLIETGWLTEQRSSYKRLTDMDPSARILLDFLLDLKAGRLRNYGGEVIQVLSLLESVDKDPSSRSQALRSAATSARGFLNHLRTISAGMRKAEQAIAAHNDFAALFETFFTDYVERHLISDYKLLHTKSSPYRFRVRILELCDTILFDEYKLSAIADGYILETRAKSSGAARKAVISDIRKVISVFENIDGYLEIIEETNKRVESRIRNTIRFFDTIEEANTETMERVLSKIGSIDSTEIPVLDNSLRTSPPSGPIHLFSPTIQRIAIKPKKIVRPVRSTALVEYERSIQRYRERSQVTPDKAETYLLDNLGQQQLIEATALRIESLDDFFIFERMRGLEFIADGALSKRWRVYPVEGMVDNDWITCRNFKIERIE